MSDLDPLNTHRASKIQRNKSQLGSGGIKCEGRWVESCGLVQTDAHIRKPSSSESTKVSKAFVDSSRSSKSFPQKPQPSINKNSEKLFSKKERALLQNSHWLHSSRQIRLHKSSSSIFVVTLGDYPCSLQEISTLRCCILCYSMMSNATLILFSSRTHVNTRKC